MEAESLLPHLQATPSCPYPEPEQSSQHLPIPHGVFIFLYKIIYRPIMILLNCVVQQSNEYGN